MRPTPTVCPREKKTSGFADAPRRARTRSDEVGQSVWAMSKGNNRQLKTRFSSLDVCAMAQSLSPLVSGYRIANVYDVNPRTCACFRRRSSLAPHHVFSQHAATAHTRPPLSQVCA